MVRPKGIPSHVKNRTYEEVYGKEKSEEYKKRMRHPKSVPSYKKGKKWEEIFGRKKAKKMRIESSKRQKGRKNTWGDKISKKLIEAHKRKQFGYKKGEQLGDKNPAKKLEVREKISDKAKGENNYFFKHHFNGPENWNWQGGKSFEPYGFEFNEDLKRLIRKRDNSKCQLCNKFGKDVHHIDYNKKNNNPVNLITLCKRCHAKTGHNRKRWLKYFKEILNGKK